ncbi:MAG: TRAP transporter small permease [Rhodospirillales bacterium]|nr:MAG: TRAP transporter small permease [Rhodospirillales bacterium]UCH74445.1 MAG: TRAP transporter small permease [Rhodospirillales bacterium]
MHYEPKSKLGRVINEIEETLIAGILGLMAVVTFANVVARYVFNSNILWALETTAVLFAWLVLLGASYCVKTRAHLGVDVVLNLLSPGPRRLLSLLAVGACLAFSVLLLIGSWNYWAPFAALPMLDGTLKDQAWYEVNDIPMLDFLRFIEGPMNQGEAYEKLPRFIPYAALPLGLFLLTFRFLQVGWRVLTGQQDTIIASHEAEDLMEEVAAEAKKEG